MTIQDILNSNLSDSHKIELITILLQGGNTPLQKSKTITPTETIIVGDLEYDVAIADTEELRKKGLEPYSFLHKNEGMLFIFDLNTTDYFTMKNCGIDLDIIFIDDEGEVIQVSSVKAYAPKPVICEEPYQFVLEVNINSGIRIGDELEQEDDYLSEEEKHFAVEHNKMLVLDINGDVQMKLSGGERIFSRICTRKMIKAAIQAYREDTDVAYRKVGRLVLKELDAQDNRPLEYTQLDNEKRKDGGVLFAQTGATVTLGYSSENTGLPQAVTYQNEGQGSYYPSIETTPNAEMSDKGGVSDWATLKMQLYLGTQTVQQDPTTGVYSSTLQQPTQHGDATKLTMLYLINKGFSKEAAAGITGVFMAESGLQAGRLNERENELYGNRAGRGLGQWTGSRRDQYESYLNGRTPTLELDLDFFIQDLESRPIVKRILLTSKNIDEIVDAMHRGYENGTSRAMTSVALMELTYRKAWQKQGIQRAYSFSDEQRKRIEFAILAFLIV